MKYILEMEELLLERFSSWDQFVDELEKYKDDDSYYVHFSNINKVGINPKQNEIYGQNGPCFIGTIPNGVYCYPIKDFWDNIKNDKLKYASDRKYAFILKIKDKQHHLKNLSKYTYINLVSDFNKIKKLYPKSKKIISAYLNNERYDYFLTNVNEKIPFTYLFNLIGEFASLNHELSQCGGFINNLFIKLGYYSIEDNEGLSIIHPAGISEAVFMNPKSYEIKDLILLKDLHNILLKDSNIIANDISNFISQKKEKIGHVATYIINIFTRNNNIRELKKLLNYSPLLNVYYNKYQNNPRILNTLISDVTKKLDYNQ